MTVPQQNLVVNILPPQGLEAQELLAEEDLEDSEFLTLHVNLHPHH